MCVQWSQSNEMDTSQVHDIDTGYNSELAIELQGVHAANFYETGGLLFCRGGLKALNKRMIEFVVSATDQRGNGTTATAYANVMDAMM